MKSILYLLVSLGISAAVLAADQPNRGATNALMLNGWWSAPGRFIYRSKEERETGQWELSARKGHVSDLYRTAVAGDVELRVGVTLAPTDSAPVAASLGLRQDLDNHVTVTLRRERETAAILFESHTDGKQLQIGSAPVQADGPLTLRLVRKGDLFTGCLRQGREWKEIGACTRALPAELGPLLRVDGRLAEAKAVFAKMRVLPSAVATVWAYFPPRADGYLFADGAPITLPATIYNLSDQPVEGALDCQAVRRLDGVVAHYDSTPFSVAPNGQTQIGVTPYLGRLGSYILRYQPQRDGHALNVPYDQSYGVVPPRDPTLTPAESGWGTHTRNDYPLMWVKWVRLWDSGHRWHIIEPEKGKWNWEPYDRIVAESREKGFAVIPVLGTPPKWAAPKGKRSYGGTSNPPDDINDWITYCRAVATRYKGVFKAYEIWNEPNYGFFNGGADEYYPLLKAAYETLKSVDPEIKVLAPSVTGSIVPFSERLLKLGGLNYMDVFSLHTYMIVGLGPYSTNPPDMPRINQGNLRWRYDKCIEMMRSAGGPVKPLCNTEVAYHYRSPINTHEDFAIDLPKYFLISFAMNVSPVTWHHTVYEQERWGPAPWTTAYSCNSAFLVRLKPVGAFAVPLTREEKSYVYVFRRGRDTLIAAWTWDGTRIPLTVRTGGKPCALYDMWTHPIPMEKTEKGRLTLTLAKPVQYLVIADGPAAMDALALTLGDPIAEAEAPPLEETGSPAPPRRSPSTPSEPGPRLRLTAYDGFVAKGKPFKLNRGRTHFPDNTARIGWKVGPDEKVAPGRYRVVARVRSSQFEGKLNYLDGYTLRVNETEVPCILWRPEPVITESWRPAYAVTSACFASTEPVTLRAGDVLSLSAPLPNAMLNRIELYAVNP